MQDLKPPSILWLTSIPMVTSAAKSSPRYLKPSTSTIHHIYTNHPVSLLTASHYHTYIDNYFLKYSSKLLVTSFWSFSLESIKRAMFVNGKWFTSHQHTADPPFSARPSHILPHYPVHKHWTAVVMLFILDTDTPSSGTTYPFLLYKKTSLHLVAFPLTAYIQWTFYKTSIKLIHLKIHECHIPFTLS